VGELRPADPLRRRLIVDGLVQGVGYRAFVVRTARALGLAGWVRNRPDGRVEVLCEGPDEAVEALTQAVEAGPPHAAITALTVAPTEPADEFPFPFDVR